jgi:hypothetical protein
MKPEVTRIVQFLMGRGLLDRSCIVAGNVMIGSDRSRHRSYGVMCKDSRSYFVKTIQPDQPNAAETLAHEADCYLVIQTEDRLARLRDLVPNFICYDKVEKILVLELLQNAENLSAVYATEKTCSPEIASALGNAIGVYHRCGSTPRSNHLRPGKPWIANYSESNFSPRASAAISNLKQIVKASAIDHALSELHGAWTGELLLHGDLKWENCLILTNESRPIVKMIDWEGAFLGDPLWDVGSLIQSYVMRWILSAPIEAGQPNFTKSEFALDMVSRATHALWAAYCSARQLSFNNAKKLLNKSVTYLASRLVQTVFERAVSTSALDSYSILLLQFAENLFINPSAGHEFFYN